MFVEGSMRRAFLLPLILLSSAAIARTAERPPSPGKGCLNVWANTLRSAPPGEEGVHRLDQLPPADEVLTVIDMEGQCQKPRVVRRGIGGHQAETMEPDRTIG
jgi:hypothetical protein